MVRGDPKLRCDTPRIQVRTEKPRNGVPLLLFMSGSHVYFPQGDPVLGGPIVKIIYTGKYDGPTCNHRRVGM